MTTLEELEQKILQIVGKNKELLSKVDELACENDSLKEKMLLLESSLIKDGDALRTLEGEKEDISSSIKSLLDSIDSLENTN